MALLGVALVLPVCGPAARTVSVPSEASPEDYQVYGAALSLMQFPKKDVYMLIWDRTLNFGCGNGAVGAPVLLNACAGMRVDEVDRPEDIVKMLEDNWPKLQKSTVADFLKKNVRSTKIHDELKTNWKHSLVGEDAKEQGGTSPDLTVYFSGVGFNSNKTEAIVYVLVFSNMDEVQTGGNYFLFRLVDKAWEPNGRVTYIQMDKSRSEWVVTSPK